MGMTFIEVEIANPAAPQKREKVELLVDSGAQYSLIPAPLVKKLGIKPYDRQVFFLANGERVERRIASAEFFFQGKRGPSKIVIGQRGDSSLMGVVTLESLGFALDPIRRELRPLKMLLA